MTSNDIIGLIITGLVGLVFVIMSIIMLLGKGASLIAGFNTMPEKEKEKYDTKALCRFMGKILLPIGVSTPLVAIAGIFNVSWLVTAYIFLVVVLVLFAVVYCNTGNRFKK